jgi:hypothetical protein
MVINVTSTKLDEALTNIDVVCKVGP